MLLVQIEPCLQSPGFAQVEREVDKVLDFFASPLFEFLGAETSASHAR